LPSNAVAEGVGACAVAGAVSAQRIARALRNPQKLIVFSLYWHGQCSGGDALMRPVIDPKPRIRWNSRTLFVTSITPSLRVWAAMSMSYVPHGVPSRTSSARICPKCVATFAENGNTLSLAMNWSTA
jgi:hypothetical protein